MIRPPNLLICIATIFGVGFIKYAPGTIATSIAIPLYMLVADTSIYIKFTVFALLFFAGIFSSSYYEFYSGQKDPGEVTIDEVAAYFFVLMFIPFKLYYVIASFIIFRFFDISKIYPIKEYERLKSGFGVMLDDFIAAVYTLLLIYILVNIL
jgi:phosphatidylglycerophosphatase A